MELVAGVRGDRDRELNINVTDRARELQDPVSPTEHHGSACVTTVE